MQPSPAKDLQYRPEGLQHLHARKMRIRWLFYTHVTCKLCARKKIHELLCTLQLHANCVYFDGSRNLFLFIHVQCVYFSQSKVPYHVYGATTSDLKLSELKLPFGVFNNRHTCSFRNKFWFVIAGTEVITMFAVQGA